VTCTQPEVAAVGEPTFPARPDRQLLTKRLSSADRAITEQSTAGFSRLVVDGRHRVRGATVVGPRAGEALAELTLAVTRGLTTSDLTAAIHPYPTYADPQWNAAIGDTLGRLGHPAARAVIGTLLVARRALAALRR
jgi:pyruvate/2-oxoglutarate dehydrogenase complex dihydrolipoamide dehydrogenase (E3) component